MPHPYQYHTAEACLLRTVLAECVMTFRDLFGKVYKREDLTVEETKEAVSQMMDGKWEASQIGAFLTSLHMKGESVDEVVGFVSTMREKAVRVPVNGKETMDTCGTGGDKKESFNISTIAAFVLAGSGIPIMKHGNRAASSACGSADLLEALGIRFRMNPEEAEESLDQNCFAFLFAPDYHPATKTVAQIRKQLAMPTIFNLLGPLTNPAHPAAQLIGVYEKRALPLLSEALRKLDPLKRSAILHSEDGWDEATPTAAFHIHTADGEPAVMNPQEFGFEKCEEQDLRGGNPKQNAEIAESILRGERSPRRDAVVLNAFLAYRVFYPKRSATDAMQAVNESIDSGAAANVVQKLRSRFPL